MCNALEPAPHYFVNVTNNTNSVPDLNTNYQHLHLFLHIDIRAAIKIMTNESAPLGQIGQHQPAGNEVIMNMINSRRPSRLTANIYGNQNNAVNQAAIAPSSLALVQPQLLRGVYSLDNVESDNAANETASKPAATDSITALTPQQQQLPTIGPNTANSKNAIQQLQVQIAGLKGLSFTLPQSSFNPSAGGANLFHNNTIDALTLSSLNGTVPEFLYQLTKMLTDEVNKEVIVWNSCINLGDHNIGG